MKFLIKILQGSLIGLGAVLPGISGGVGQASCNLGSYHNSCAPAFQYIQEQTERPSLQY